MAAVDEGLPPLAFWHALADAADRETSARFRANTAVDDKLEGRGFDPVTEADRESERAIRALIEVHYPGHAILGEEMGAREGGEHRWVIDPIDGTRAFITGLPTWMTLIGLERGGRAVAGLASQPVTGERFVAPGDGTAHCRVREQEVPLRVSGRVEPTQAIAMTTDPYLFGGDTRVAFERVRAGVRLTRYGADAYAFCLLAAGTVDIAFEVGVAPYDIGGLIPIVEAAGGLFTTWDGGRPEGGGAVVASASPQLHQWALGTLNAG